MAKTSAPRAAPPTTLARLAPPVERPGPASDRENDGSSGVDASILMAVPDAEPAVEPIRLGGPNRPYQLRGRSYVPLTEDLPFRETGLASWYGRKFHGRRTASGELYDMHAMTAAHPTLPLPSYVRVVNPANGREVVVRVNDRGPFYRGRIIDLSYAAAHRLGVTRGLAKVEIERLTFEDIRTGAWRRSPREGDTLQAAAPARPGAPTAADQVLVAQTPPPQPAAPSVGHAGAAAADLATAALGSAASAVPLPAAVVAAQTPAAAAQATAAPSSAPSALSAPDSLLALVSTREPAPAADAASAVPAAAAAAAASDTSMVAADSPGQAAPPKPGFWVQLGAFRMREGAEGFQRRVGVEAPWLAPALDVLNDQDLHRLLAGPYPSQDEAHGVAQRVREALSLVPMVIERR